MEPDQQARVSRRHFLSFFFYWGQLLRCCPSQASLFSSFALPLFAPIAATRTGASWWLWLFYFRVYILAFLGWKPFFLPTGSYVLPLLLHLQWIGEKESSRGWGLQLEHGSCRPIPILYVYLSPPLPPHVFWFWFFSLLSFPFIHSDSYLMDKWALPCRLSFHTWPRMDWIDGGEWTK